MDSNYGIVPGVHIEVLWDVEECIKGGRRAGSKSLVSVWWRAQVLDIEQADDKLKVKLRYDGRDGFSEQCGSVWMFPRHVKLLEDSSTQLRWRFYECSGDVEYGFPEHREDLFHENNSVLDNGLRVSVLEGKVATLLQKYEALERLMVSQSNMYSSLIGSGSAGDRQCHRLLSILRRKVAIMMQRPLPSPKYKKDDEGRECYFEYCSTGRMKTEVDCDLQEFEVIARVVRSKTSSAYFEPPFPETQSLSQDRGVAEIQFSGLTDLCNAIGITSVSDMLTMARRGRGTITNRDRCSAEPVLRFLGSYILDRENETSPCAFLLCQAAGKQFLDVEVNALIRESRHFDFAALSYRDELRSERLTTRSLLTKIFRSRFNECSISADEDRTLRGIMKDMSKFTLRWRCAPEPNARLWTRSLVMSEHTCGILEIEFPFIIFRGDEVVQEVQTLATDCFLRQQLSIKTSS